LLAVCLLACSSDETPPGADASEETGGGPIGRDDAGGRDAEADSAPESGRADVSGWPDVAVADADAPPWPTTDGDPKAETVVDVPEPTADAFTDQGTKPDVTEEDAAPDARPDLADAAPDVAQDVAADAPCRVAPVVLGAAGPFAVLAGSTVVSTGPTTITGDLGVSPGTAVTGFPPGMITGALHSADTVSALATADLTTAYNDAAARMLCTNGVGYVFSVAGDLGGRTLTPGIFKSLDSLEITSGDLTLDARGDAGAVWIFQMATTLTTASGRQVILAGGASAGNIFWQVGTSATLGSTSGFQGTVMADQAITLGTGATIAGRALARIAAISLDSAVVVKP